MAAVAGESRGDLAGYPVPVDGYQMTVAPGVFPASIEELKGVKEALPWSRDRERTFVCGNDDIADDQLVRNEFYSITRRMWYYVVWHGCKLVKTEGGPKPYIQPSRVELLPDPWRGRPGRRLKALLGTLDAGAVWSLEAESMALEKLSQLVTPHQFRTYSLTGIFVEQSKRSHASYIFRRLRPTVVILPTKSGGDTRIACCLCMHPLAYYEGTWAGAMVPTDDVIAHLVLMRSDEHMYWRKCNQHPAWAPEAGL